VVNLISKFNPFCTLNLSINDLNVKRERTHEETSIKLVPKFEFVELAKNNTFFYKAHHFYAFSRKKRKTCFQLVFELIRKSGVICFKNNSREIGKNEKGKIVFSQEIIGISGNVFLTLRKMELKTEQQQSFFLSFFSTSYCCLFF